MSFPSFNLLTSLPILFLSGLIFVLLLVEAFVRKAAGVTFWLSVVGVAATAFFSILTIGQRAVSYSGMVLEGGYASFFNLLFLGAAFVTIIVSREYLTRTHTNFGEFYLLILLATLGMMLMAAAEDLIMIFIGVELMSVCLYVLAGFFRRKLSSNESSLKYFLLGAFSTGFLLYGIALIYGAAHTTNIADIAHGFAIVSQVKYFWMGVGLLLIGLAFKVAAVPFHMWVPDVYEGAPTTVTGFMSTGAKAAAFSAIVLVFGGQANLGANFTLAVAIISAASMILGNIVAISQSNIKRMLAYSSIAHAGYMLIGVAALNAQGREGILFYIASYVVMNLGAFGVIALLERADGSHLTLDEYAGAGKRQPLLAALLSIFMFSLAGLPPFGGFFGKYYLFLAAVNADLTWLAVLAVLTSAIGAYYYLRVIVKMYFSDSTDETPSPSFTPMSVGSILLAASAIIVIGICPGFLLDVIRRLF